jgi:hypothetical protein
MTDMKYAPKLPPGLAAQVADIAATGDSGMATLYDREAQMLLQAGFDKGKLIGWTVIHPLSVEEAETLIDKAPGVTIPSVACH